MDIQNREVEYVKKVIRFDVVAFGKTFRVEKWQEDGNMGEYDNDYEILTENWEDGLSEEQQEELDDFISDVKVFE